MNSIWTVTSDRPNFRQLSGDKKTDVLIIGAGACGILCAYMLKQAGVDCIVCEADKICGGITKDTTAKITLQHGLIYDKIIRRYGVEHAKGYLLAQKAAMQEYEDLCSGINSDWEVRPSYVYSLDDPKRIEREVRAYEKIGHSASFTRETELPFSVAGAVRLEDQAQIHPLKLFFSIAEGVPIYENTKITELSTGLALTAQGSIRAKNIIVATHFPFINKHGAYFIKLYQHRSYVIALEGAMDIKGMYVDEADKGMSFRSYKELLLVGGGGHRTGKKGGCWGELEDFSRRHYPESEIRARWAAQDCMSLDGMPYIGRYSRGTDGLFVATGFNKWGMTSSMVAAQILCDLVQGKKNSFEEIFSPSRSVLHPQLALNGAESLIGLLTPTAPRCPHLGCALKYNAAEHTWDCSCHGSRFTESGELINNPATDDKDM